MTASYYPISRQRPELLTQRRPGEHVWVVAAAFRVQTASILQWRAAGGPIYLDAETLATVEIGCFVCETEWSESVALSRCPGEPR